MRILTPMLAVLALAAATAGRARAQCLDWTPGYTLAGIAGYVDALAVFDDGSGNGPELYVGGEFQFAGAVAARNVARWNGTRWAAVGTGRPERVLAFCVWDDGNGPALYTGLDLVEGYVPPTSTLSILAKWDGVAWTGLPGGVDFGEGRVAAMTVHDDGTGSALYVGGIFHTNGPAWPQANNIARFDGTSWSPVGNGILANGYPRVAALASFDDGGGPRLYAGGYFLRVGPGTTPGPVLSFDGTQWQLASAGLVQFPAEVHSFARFGPGGGTLHAAGDDLFGQNQSGFVQLNGSVWSGVGGNVYGDIRHLLPVTTALGDRLIVSGSFVAPGVPSNGIASWDGSVWSSVGTPPANFGALASYDEGAGPRLFSAASMVIPGAPDPTGIARFDGSARSALGPGLDLYPYPGEGFVTFDDGQGAAVYAGSQWGVLRRVGDQWISFGNLSREVTALHVHDDGVHGPSLYAAFRSPSQWIAQVARWDGAAWSFAGAGLSFANPNWNASVYDMTSLVHAGASLLVVGGDFDLAGGQTAPFTAAWDGAAWVSLGTGLNHIVFDVEAFDDGTGPALFAAGVFWNVPGGSTGIARWNGTSWTSPGPGAPPARALHVHDSGSGPRLYVSRRTNVPGWSAGLDVFDGTTWSPVVSGVSPGALASYDDGSGGGPRLVACGGFGPIGGVDAHGIASFDGRQWHALGGGFTPNQSAYVQLAVHDDGAGAALFVLGVSGFSGDHACYGLARYGPTGGSGCVLTTGSVTCAGDGGGAACPCGNTGGADRGCGNSANASGAVLVAEGQAHRSSDNVTLRASGMTPGGAALFFQGTQSVAGGAGVAFGDGVRCVSGTQVRLAIRSVVGGVASFGDAVPGDPTVSSAGQLPWGASSRDYQVWYRDAQSFCTTSTFNLTNALRLRWAP